MKHIATWIEENKDEHFNKLLAGSDFRLWNARVEEVPWDDVGGVLLSGGSDVAEQYLTQPVPDPSQIKDPNPARDKWDIDATHKGLSSGLPLLAICRGHQVLNVALGGTLHLDIPGHNLKEQYWGNVQELVYAPGAEFRFPHVNSSHHQAIDQLGDNLEIEARHAVDDTIEQVRLRAYPFCIGVQFHPERNLQLYRPLFDAFLARVK